jgi:hypothetical protein
MDKCKHMLFPCQGGRLLALTAAVESSQIGATALVRQLQAIVHHLGGERGRLELRAHALLVHALHHLAALPAGRRRMSTLDGSQTGVQCVGVAHSRCARLAHHAGHHDHEHSNDAQSSSNALRPMCHG